MNKAAKWHRDREEGEARRAWPEARREGDVLIWNSNDRHPMADMLAVWRRLGLITEEVETATTAARTVANAGFFEEYRKARAARTPDQIAEEAFELRAAFGPGETVVDLFTGETTTT